jgi:succinate dehydrogenase / fumarate reductase cytochrome b subunit
MPDASLKKKRPLWYNLSLLNLPLPGLVSILHRISGAALFLLLLWLLYLLDGSLASAERFEAVRHTVSQPLAKVVLLGLLWSFLHHLCAGIRYLFLDIHTGVDLASARATSGVVLAVSLVLTALLGWRLLW